MVGYDFSMMLLSYLATWFSMFATFSFVNSLYKASSKARGLLLIAYSLMAGFGLFVVHFINMITFAEIVSTNLSFVNLGFAYFFSVLIAYFGLNAASKKKLIVSSLLANAFISGIFGFVVYYFCIKSMKVIGIHFDTTPVILSTIVSMIVVGINVKSLFWIKSNPNKYPLLSKIVIAFFLALSIFVLHIAFHSTIIIDANAVAEVSRIYTPKTVSTIGAALIISLFLFGFLIVFFYDKLHFNFSKIKQFKQELANIEGQYETLDPLTQLPNRAALKQHLESAIKRCERVGDNMALAYIDLDHFKPVNDSFGHHVGDQLLMEVANRLNTAIRSCDIVARTGGDEFVALIEEITSTDDIVPVAQRIVDSIKESFEIDGHHIEISCSVGIAIYQRNGDIEKLMLNADAAMYKAKEAGKNQYKFYDAEIEFASDQMQKMHAELEAAVNENQFVLYFQPKFDCNTEAPVGAEALLRWNHPTKGLLKPIDFLPAAERFGLIDKINTWVIVETCQSIYRARKAGIMLNVSVNLSRQQFRNPELVEYIKKVMSQHNISPNSLIFEVSETNAIKNQNQFKSLLSKFKLAHLKVSIDDFGSHPFSLSYLQNLEISEVKLDKQFVAEITRHKSSRAMVEAVVKLAHALNLNVVAEGVETEEQRATISAAGCNQMQGFLFSDAVPEKQLLKMFRQISDNFEKTGSFSATEFNIENA